MKLHTTLSREQIRTALRYAKIQDTVGTDIVISRIDSAVSRSHSHAYELMLGSCQKHRPDGKCRRVRVNGAYDWERYAATWDEWGWFIAQIMKMDPHAKFGPYRNSHHFHEMTKGAYRLPPGEGA
jgi:hypothetical protein